MPQLGDGPVEPRYAAKMRAAASVLDEMFNGYGDVLLDDRSTGFVLLVFPFGEKDGRCNYISNGADRTDVVKLLKEQIKQFEEGGTGG